MIDTDYKVYANKQTHICSHACLHARLHANGFPRDAPSVLDASAYAPNYLWLTTCGTPPGSSSFLLNEGLTPVQPIPFIPPHPIPSHPIPPARTHARTHAQTFALVRGAKDLSFVQIYSRTPRPGKAFISRYKTRLGGAGYDAGAIVDTPQDCTFGMMRKMDAMMKSSDMEALFSNTASSPFSDLTSRKGGGESGGGWGCHHPLPS